MEKSRIAVIVLIFVVLLSVPAQAQVIPGRWEKVEALQLGPQITVKLKNGARIEGQCEELSLVRALAENRHGSGEDPESGHRTDHHS